MCKKNKNKQQTLPKKIVRKKVNFDRNTTKYYNIFTIPLFSTVLDLSLIFYFDLQKINTSLVVKIL